MNTKNLKLKDSKKIIQRKNKLLQYLLRNNFTINMSL